MREKKTDPELPIVLPFQPGPASNGEYVPLDPTPAHQQMAASALLPTCLRSASMRVPLALTF